MSQLFLKIKEIWKRAFVRDVATLQMGSIFSTGLSFIASVIFARILGASQYGIYSLIFAFTALVGIFMDWGANYATLTIFAKAYVEKDRPQIVNILTYFLKLSLIISFTIGLLAVIFSPKISILLYHDPKIGELARIVLVTIIIRFFFSLITISLQVLRKIKYLTILENINKLFDTLIPAGLVLLNLGLLGVVLGHLISAVIFLVFSIITYSYLAKKNELLPSLKELFLNLKRVKINYYFKFGLLIAIDNNIAKLYKLLPITFLAMFVSSQEVAFYKIAFAYITIPTVLLGPVSRLLMVQLPKSNSYGLIQLKKDFTKVCLHSVIISASLVILFIILGPFLITFFYGPEFKSAIPLIYYLAIYPALSGLGIGLGAIFRTLNKMRVVIKINALSILIGSPIGFYLIKRYLLLGVVSTVVLWHLLSTFITLIYIYRYLSRKIKEENGYESVK